MTLSVAAILQLRRPRVLRGMLPYGVRTFLKQASRLTSDHLPSALILAQFGIRKRTADYADITDTHRFGQLSLIRFNPRNPRLKFILNVDRLAPTAFGCLGSERGIVP